MTNEQCGDTEAISMFVLTQLVYWLSLCMLFLFQGGFRPLFALLPAKVLRKLKPKKSGDGGDNGGLSTVIYYFQLTALAVPKGTQKLASGGAAITCYAGRLLGMQQLPSWAECNGGPTADVGVCITRDMSAITIMAWPLLVPPLLIMLLRGTACVLRWGQDCKKEQTNTTQQATSSGYQALGNGSHGSSGSSASSANTGSSSWKRSWGSWNSNASSLDADGDSKNNLYVSANCAREPLLAASATGEDQNTGGGSGSSVVGNEEEGQREEVEEFEAIGTNSIVPAIIKLLLFSFEFMY